MHFKWILSKLCNLKKPIDECVVCMIWREYGPWHKSSIDAIICQKVNRVVIIQFIVDHCRKVSARRHLNFIIEMTIKRQLDFYRCKLTRTSSPCRRLFQIFAPVIRFEAAWHLADNIRSPARMITFWSWPVDNNWHLLSQIQGHST